MNQKIIETHNLTKKFGSLFAVDNIDIHVNKGEIIGFLGPNGAGKTTTLSMMSTILSPTKGDIIIDGYSVQKNPDKIRSLIGVCPQEIILYDYLTARENAEFFAHMHGLPKKVINERIITLFEKLGLTDKLNARSSTLSGGMKRRLNIILALVMDPKIIFFDEPSAGLDPQSARLTREFIRSLRDEDKTIILTTHNMRDAEELCDRIYIIDHGKIIAEGTPQNLKANFGQGEIIEMKFKEENNGFKIDDLKFQIEKLGSFIHTVQVLSKTRMVISASGGVQRLLEIEKLLPNSLSSLENLNIRTNNLEDVFLLLTGNALRE